MAAIDLFSKYIDWENSDNESSESYDGSTSSEEDDTDDEASDTQLLRQRYLALGLVKVRIRVALYCNRQRSGLPQLLCTETKTHTGYVTYTFMSKKQTTIVYFSAFFCYGCSAVLYQRTCRARHISGISRCLATSSRTVYIMFAVHTDIIQYTICHY